MNIPIVTKPCIEITKGDHPVSIDDNSKGSATITSTITSTAVADANPNNNNNKKRTHDDDDDDSDEAVAAEDDVAMERLAAKRAYNRECASRARQRGKALLATLENQVRELHHDKTELRRTLVTMEKRVLELQKENDILMGREVMSAYKNSGSMSNVNLGVGVEPSAAAALSALFFQSGPRTSFTSNSSNLNASVSAAMQRDLGYNRNQFY